MMAEMIKIFSSSEKSSVIIDKNQNFDNLLLEKWTNAMDNGIFRYSLKGMRTRIVPGSKKYIIQLNLKRASERRKPQDINSINLPFDDNSFNFTKVPSKEKIFSLIDSDGIIDESAILVNVSPCENGHTLIVPEINLKINQVLTYNSILLSLKIIELSRSKYFRVVFNTLCAFASVNHLHLHTWYLEQELFTEKMPVTKISDNISLQHLHKCKGFVVHCYEGMSLASFSRQIFNITDLLFRAEIAYNLFISKFTGRIDCFIWPRKHVTGVKISTKEEVFNVAAFELAGHIPIFCEDEFEKITEQEIDKKIMSSSLETEQFNNIIDDILKL